MGASPSFSLPLLPESYLSLMRKGGKSPKVRTLVLTISSQSMYLGEIPEACIPWARQSKIKSKIKSKINLQGGTFQYRRPVKKVKGGLGEIGTHREAIDPASVAI